MRRLGLGIAIAALAAAASSLLVPESDSARTARPAFSFSVSPPGPPAAIAGEKYAGFWFCQPRPPGTRQCGAGYRTTNPRGGFPPYTFSMRSVVPGLHVNVRTGLLSGTVPAGGQVREWRLVVCATESRTPLYQRPRTRCVTTQIRIEPSARFAGTYEGTVTWSGPPGVTISPGTEPISFTVRQGDLGNDLDGTVDAAGRGTVTALNPRFWGTSAFTGTLTFTRSDTTVSVTGTIEGTANLFTGPARIKGDIKASRAAPS